MTSQSGDSSGKHEQDEAAMDQALVWFARLRKTSPDAATFAEFKRWEREDPRNKRAYRSLENLWGSAEPAVGAERLPQWRLGRPDWRAGERTRPWPLALAALLVAALIGLGFWQGPSLLLRWKADHITAAGSRETVPLPDGSTMILNSDTAVAVRFSEGHRRVEVLRGEAYFAVAPNSASVFEVDGTFCGVTATGTAFSVRTDGNEDHVVLEHGRVVVRDLEAPQRRAILSAGETVNAQNSGLSFVGSVDAKRALAWREGKAIFANEPLSEVIAELSRYRSAPVFLLNDAIAQNQISGEYPLDDADAAIAVVAEASGARMTRLPGGVLILR